MEEKKAAKTQMEPDEMERISGGAETGPAYCPYCQTLCKDTQELFLHIRMNHQPKK